MIFWTKSTISGTYSLTRVKTSGGRTWGDGKARLQRTSSTAGSPAAPRPQPPPRAHLTAKSVWTPQGLRVGGAQRPKVKTSGDTHVQGLHVLVEFRLPELGQLREDGIVRHFAAMGGIQPVGKQVLCFCQQHLEAKKQNMPTRARAPTHSRAAPLRHSGLLGWRAARKTLQAQAGAQGRRAEEAEAVGWGLLGKLAPRGVGLGSSTDDG